MSKILDALKLSKLTGGINRFKAQARPDQCIDALDVWEREDDLVRRPSYEVYGIAPPFMLPHGAVTVVHEDPNGTFTTVTSRAFTFDVDEVSGVGGRIWIGCEEMFAGIVWQRVTSTPSASNTTGNAVVAPQFLNANYTSGTPTLVPILGVYDSTRKQIVNGSSVYFQPLWRDGVIAWDNTPRSSLWVARSLNGVSRYWVALDIAATKHVLNASATPIQFPVSSGSFTVSAPGIRAFVLNPVNGLVSTKFGNRSPCLVVGSDFTTPRAAIPGAGIGFIKQPDEGPEIARIVEDYGGAIIGEYPQPNWAGGTTAIGTAGVLTKDDQSYSWFIGQFNRSQVVTFGSNASINNTVSQVCLNLAAAILNGNRNILLNCQGFTLRCTARIGNGPAVGEEREIYKISTSGSDLILHVYDDLSDAADANNNFEVLTPPSKFRTDEGRVDYGITSHSAHALTPIASARPYSQAFVTGDADKPVNFIIFKESFFALESGNKWCAMFDPITGKTILTNGRNGLWEYDGNHFKRLEAAWDTTANVAGAARVSQWAGVVRDVVVESNNPDLLSQGQLMLRRPPDCDFIIDYNGRIVTARDQLVRWSAPGLYNDIWPAVYASSIRDAENEPITGLRTVGDRVVAFTKTSMHLGGPPNERGEISFNPVVQGMGFVSHYAVDNMTYDDRSAICGVTPDGIYIFDGADLTPIITDWKQILEHGVNVRALSKAVAVMWRQEGVFLAAVPSAGSNVNDKLVVIDVAGKKIWLWTAPRCRNGSTPAAAANAADTYAGITMLARDVDESGIEKILVGTSTGFIFTFAEGTYDYDGAYVLGRAQSAPVPFDDREIAPNAILLHMQEMGDHSTGTFAPYVEVCFDRDDRVRQSEEVVASAAEAVGVFGDNFGTPVYSGDKIVPYKVNLQSGVRGHQIDFTIRCAGRFRFAGADLLYTLKGQKGVLGT